MQQFIRNLVIGTWMFGMVAVPFGFAQEAGSYNPNEDLVNALIKEEVVTIEDLEVENPGILSTNPFYFIKRLRRSTWRVFRFNSLKRAELELNILNEKAAELKRLQEIIPDDSDALIEALNLYQENIVLLDYLIGKLDNFDKDDYDDFLTNFFSTGIRHVKLFDELKSESDTRFVEKLNEAQDQLGGIMAKGIMLDGSDSFKERFPIILGNQRGSILKEIKITEVIDRFQSGLPLDSLENQFLARLKEDLVLRTEAKLVAEDLRAILPAFIERLPGDMWRKIKMLDESREYVTDSNLRNDLTLIRQLAIDLTTQTREISKPRAEKLVREATNLLELLEGRRDNLKNSYIKSMLTKAGFNLEQAESSMDNGHHIQAFGQASIAMASLQNALGQSLFVGESGDENFVKELQGLKQRYDNLVDMAEEINLDYQDVPELRDIFLLSEEALVELSDNKDNVLSVIVPDLREVKILLAQLEIALENVINSIELKAEEKRAAQSLIKKVLFSN